MLRNINSNNKKVFITGSSGFIGRNLKEYLEKNFIIIAPNHNQLDLLNEKAVYKFLKSNYIDVVIHCATHDATAYSTKDKNKVFYNNLRMFINLTRVNKLYGKMIYFGSGAEYDMRNYIPKMKEDYFDKNVPIDDYGFSKYIMAKYIRNTDNIYNLRLFGCFGKYEDWRIRFISNTICKALYDMDITIRQNIFLDYLYIDDLNSIIEYFIEAKKLNYNYYNICTNTIIDLLSLAKIIINLSGKKLKVNILSKGIKKEYSGDNSLLQNDFKNLQFTHIDTAIKELYGWYRNNKSLIDPNLL